MHRNLLILALLPMLGCFPNTRAQEDSRPPADSDADADADADSDGDGYTFAQGDCDDRNAAVNPGAQEYCATVIDDNCDGNSNDLDALGCTPFYEDRDSDGYGGAATRCLCAASTTYPVDDTGDCDDSDGRVNPDAPEICNDGVDNNCDGGPGACALESGSLSAAVTYTEDAADDYAGYSVSAAGDVDADGYDDMLVGAYGNDDGASGNAGAAYLVFGGASPRSRSLSAAVQFTGESYGDGAGLSVSGAGDVNADGYADMLVGAGVYDGGHGEGWYGGTMYLVLGSAHPTAASLGSTITYTGVVAGEAARTVSGAGDFNDDGYDDMLVSGSSSIDYGVSYQSHTYLIMGSRSPASASLATAVTYTGDGAGDSSGAGDVDGDGFDDILVGAYGNDDGGLDAGGAYLLLGSATPSSANLSNAVRYLGEAAGDYAGNQASAAGDVNADGYGDVVVGAPGAHGTGGVVYLVLGSSTPSSASLATAVEYWGEVRERVGGAVSNAGDVDADGYDDIIVGSYARTADDGGRYVGAAYLVFGATTPASDALTNAVRYTGETANSAAGTSVSGAGDVNGDGRADMLVGAPVCCGGTGVSAAYLLLGAGL